MDDTARRGTELQLFEAERMRGIGEMAATVAHEVNQPLQIIRLAAEVAIEEIDAPVGGNAIDTAFTRDKLERVVAQVERAARIVNELRAYARNAEGEEAVPFDLGAAVRGAVDLTQHSVTIVGIAIQANVPKILPLVLGHLSRLEQVLINLINNARDSLSETKTPGRENLISISVALAPRDGRDFLRIAIEDTGPGIAEDVLPRLFKAIVTTKPRGKGTGLGLPLCARIVEEMGGAITAGNRPEGGARFEITLPAVADPQPQSMVAE